MPCFGLLLSLFSNKSAKAQAADSSINEDGVKVYKFIQRVPQFRGDLNGYMLRNLRYPDSARARGIEGRVLVSFVVDARGHVDSVHVKDSVHPLLDAEAVRVVRKMPRWVPGLNKPDNRRIITYMTLPVTFMLD